MTTNGNNNIKLDLRISDPELREELKKHEEGEERDAFAIQAMRIGVMAIRHAQGQIDVDKIQREGDRIIENTKSTLTNYLDPDRGHFHRQIQQLIKQDGELEKAIRKQIEGSDSPLNQTLAEWIGKILEEFSLDDKDSSLRRLGNELQAKYNEFIKNLDQRIGSKKAAQKAPAKGNKFEDDVFNFINNKWSQHAVHIPTRTGRTPGLKGNNKGDVVIKLDSEHKAAGCKIVVEAKAVEKFTQKQALEELKKARENREAEVGLFVSYTSPDSKIKERFSRFGNDIIIVWDAEDENSDVNFEAGLSLAVALCVKAKIPSKEGVDPEAMDNAISKIENEVKNLDEITKSANSIKKTSDQILEKAEEMCSDLKKQIRILKENIDGLR